jgi:hypothetical protein
MHTEKIVTLATALLMTAILAGCAANNAPRGYLSSASEAQQEAYGAWIDLDTLAVSSAKQIRGEFIAFQGGSVYVLTQDSLVVLATAKIQKATLTSFDSQYGVLAMWAVLGGLSSFSHGFGAMISLPVWALAGFIATIGQSYSPQTTYPPEYWTTLSRFARYPQGVPTGLDLRMLKPRD